MILVCIRDYVHIIFVNRAFVWISAWFWNGIATVISEDLLAICRRTYMQKLTILISGRCNLDPVLHELHSIQLDVLDLYRILEAQLVSVTSMTTIVNITAFGSISRVILRSRILWCWKFGAFLFRLYQCWLSEISTVISIVLRVVRIISVFISWWIQVCDINVDDLALYLLGAVISIFSFLTHLFSNQNLTRVQINNTGLRLLFYSYFFKTFARGRLLTIVVFIVLIFRLFRGFGAWCLIPYKWTLPILQIFILFVFIIHWNIHGKPVFEALTWWRAIVVIISIPHVAHGDLFFAYTNSGFDVHLSASYAMFQNCSNILNVSSHLKEWDKIQQFCVVGITVPSCYRNGVLGLQHIGTWTIVNYHYVLHLSVHSRQVFRETSIMDWAAISK